MLCVVLQVGVLCGVPMRPDEIYDVFLSVPESRHAAYRELDKWLDWYLAETSDTATKSERG